MPPLNVERLKLAMKLADLTAVQLARKSGYSESYISQLCSGKRSASRDAEGRQRIADALGVPVDWIEEA